MSLDRPGPEKSLSDLFTKTGMTFNDCAHLCIDHQPRMIEYFKEHEIASDVIQSHVAPFFNKVGVSTYWVVFPGENESIPQTLVELKQDMSDWAGMLHQVVPSDIDQVIPKNQASALQPFSEVQASLTQQAIERDKKSILFISGYCADVCVKETIKEAFAAGYHPVWIQDASDPVHPDNLIELQQMATITNAEEVSSLMKQHALRQPDISIP